MARRRLTPEEAGFSKYETEEYQRYLEDQDLIAAENAEGYDLVEAADNALRQALTDMGLPVATVSGIMLIRNDEDMIAHQVKFSSDERRIQFERIMAEYQTAMDEAQQKFSLF